MRFVIATADYSAHEAILATNLVRLFAAGWASTGSVRPLRGRLLQVKGR